MSVHDKPASGWFEGPTHHLPIRIYYEDTDFSGLVYHANYVRFMERGRTEALRQTGRSHGELLDGEDLVFVVRRLDLQYHVPAKIDDALMVKSTFTRIRGARLNLQQAVWRDDTLLVSADVELAVINGAGIPRRLPKELAAILAPFVAATT